MPDSSPLWVLRERHAWLGARIQAKQSIRWDTEYDERERSALAWAIRKLDPETSDAA